MFADVSGCQLLVCGGDGTVGWILSSLDQLKVAGLIQTIPPVATIPLGTGNDLARCLNWGGGYEGEDVGKLLHKIREGDSVLLDRWNLNVTLSEPCVRHL